MVINYMSNGRVMIIHLMVGLIKKIWCDSIKISTSKNEQI